MAEPLPDASAPKPHDTQESRPCSVPFSPP